MPWSAKSGLAGPGGLDLLPEIVQGLGREPLQAQAPGSGQALHGRETTEETGVGPPESRLGVQPQVAGPLGQGEEKVPQLVLLGLEIAGLGQLGQLLPHLLPDRLGPRPVEAHPARPLAQALGPGQGGQGLG